jgi:DNA-binding transcriptional MocR family regulator
VKIVISVPDPVFQAGERLADQLKLSRSQLYSKALAAYLSSGGATAVTARLDAIYGSMVSTLDPCLARAQIASVGTEAW